jgi:hypothetical protein
MTHTTVRPRNVEGDFPFNWLGLPASRSTLSLFDAAQAIPAFVKRPFQAAPGVPRAAVNPYFEVTVRLPTDEDPSEVPVGLVSRNYQLVQHHEVLQRAASMLASFGIDLKTVKELAGHKTITMTDRYAHLAPDHLREAAERAVLPVQTGTETDTSHLGEQLASSENVQQVF